MSEEYEFRAQRRFIKAPDTKARDETLAALNAQIKQKDTALEEIKKLIAGAVTDPKVAAGRKALIDELKELRKTQGDLKNKRMLINNKIKEVDNSLKRKIAEVQAVTSKYNFKSVGDIDSRIAKFEDDISSGELALVEERRLVKEISNMRKIRRDFASLEQQQQSIDEDKEKIAQLKKELSAFNSRETSERFDAVQKELDELSLSNKSTNDKRDVLYKQRTAIHAEKDTLYASLKKTREDFDQQFKAFKKAMDEERKRAADEEAKYKADKAKSERKSKLEKELSEASKPAFEYEIDTIHALLTFFDPSHVKPVEQMGFNSSTSNKTARVVDSADDYVVIKKDEEVFFAGSKAKGKKNKKTQKKFTLGPDVISQLGDLEVNLPTSQEQVPAIIDELKAKLDKFVSVQKETTDKNIESAKAKIAKLEAQWAKEDAKEAAAQAAEEEAADAAVDADEE